MYNQIKSLTVSPKEACPVSVMSVMSLVVVVYKTAVLLSETRWSMLRNIPVRVNVAWKVQVSFLDKTSKLGEREFRALMPSLIAISPTPT